QRIDPVERALPGQAFPPRGRVDKATPAPSPHPPILEVVDVMQTGLARLAHALLYLFRVHITGASLRSSPGHRTTPGSLYRNGIFVRPSFTSTMDVIHGVTELRASCSARPTVARPHRGTKVQEPKTTNPIFVGGVPRSGTTLVRV